MILDFEKFIREREGSWKELAEMLDAYERGGAKSLDLHKAKRLHALYGKTSNDLVRISAFSAESELRIRLETLVSRAYALIHDADRNVEKFSVVEFFVSGFPCAFRRNLRSFRLSVVIAFLGFIFGFCMIPMHQEAKEAIIPGSFSHLHESPEERVSKEEKSGDKGMRGERSVFAAYLFTNNVKVSIFVFALGITFGVGTALVLFYNGVLLGAVFADFMLAGQSLFVFGWLLPHGSIEIPAILISGQAGLIIANALLKPSREGRKMAFRLALPDISKLVIGVALLLVYAAFIEAFFSQMHAPQIPYWLKISFGLAELAALIAYLGLAGKGTEKETRI